MKKLFIYTAIFFFSCQNGPSSTGDNSGQQAPVTETPANTGPADNPASGSAGTQNTPEPKNDNSSGTDNNTGEKNPPNPQGNYTDTKANVNDTSQESNTGKGKVQNIVNQVKVEYTDQKGRLNDTAQEGVKKIIKKH